MQETMHVQWLLYQQIIFTDIHGPTYLDSRIKSLSVVAAKILVLGAFYMAAILEIQDGRHNVYSEWYN